MKNLFLTLVIFCSLISASFAQNCTGDSVVILHSHESYGLNRINTDTFEIATGRCKHNTREYSANSGNVYNSNSTSNFIRKYIERNSQNDTSSYYEFQGTGTGYNNKLKILLSYDPVSNLITSRSSFLGTGLIWNLSQQEDWIYNSDNKLINYESLKDDGSGTMVNDKHTSYNYTGSRLDDIVYQIGQGISWVDSYRYLITYDVSDIRDSLILEKWDTNFVSWVDSSSFHYDPTNNYYVQTYWANLYFDTINNSTVYDTVCLVLDTFNLPRSYYYILNNYQNIGQYEYDYIRNMQVATYESLNSSGCFFESSNTFDTNGVVTYYNGSSACFMQQYSSANYLYDSLYRITYSHSSTFSGSGGGDYDHHYYYANDNSISFRYLSMEELNYVSCIGDSANTAAIILGGCGKYHFQWSPSVGLSSDTLKQPKIFVNDTITYHITVTDSVGNTASAVLFITPPIIAYLNVDSTTCVSCPFNLIASYYSPRGTINVSYQWYRNDSLLFGATQRNYSATIQGIYRVEITSPSPNSCISSSNEFIVLINRIERTVFSNISIYPNPAKEIVTIKGLPENSSITLFDITGKNILIQSQKNSSIDEYSIDVRNLTESFYFIDIENNGIHSKYKLVIVKK